jgi:nucleoid DNA-binding protein
MNEVKNSLETGDNVYLRGFGSFIVKTRAEKTGSILRIHNKIHTIFCIQTTKVL